MGRFGGAESGGGIAMTGLRNPHSLTCSKSRLPRGDEGRLNAVNPPTFFKAQSFFTRANSASTNCQLTIFQNSAT